MKKILPVILAGLLSAQCADYISNMGYVSNDDHNYVIYFVEDKTSKTDSDCVAVGRCLLELFENGATEVVIDGHFVSASDAVEMATY